MSAPPSDSPDAAGVPEASIVALLQALVRLPSRAGEDGMAPIVAAVEDWLRRQGLAFERLRDARGEPLALYAEVAGTAPAAAHGQGHRPWIVLDATLDTAGFGDPRAWRFPPTSARIEDGRLHGRGSADSKAGAALFCHLLRDFAARRHAFRGRLGLLLDLDEHTGGFAGARAFFEGAAQPRPDGVWIGYPGCHRIVAGARGFLRARITVPGIAAHSGGGTRRGVNAVLRAAELALALESAGLGRDGAADGFGHPGQLTVTALHGGSGFTQVPDRCELALDLRLTPAFDAEAARAGIEALLRAHDARWPQAAAASIDWIEGWPAYRLADDAPLVAALREGAREVLGRELPVVAAGPSNIGNYLAARGIPALCGFGVAGDHVHAADESVEIASIAPVWRVMRSALRRLLA